MTLKHYKIKLFTTNLFGMLTIFTIYHCSSQVYNLLSGYWSLTRYQNMHSFVWFIQALRMVIFNLKYGYEPPYRLWAKEKKKQKTTNLSGCTKSDLGCHIFSYLSRVHVSPCVVSHISKGTPLQALKIRPFIPLCIFFSSRKSKSSAIMSSSFCIP